MAANPLPAPTLRLSTEKSPAESVVRCSGKVTLETADELRQAARELLTESQRVVLDFTGVTYLDSSGLGTIIGLMLTSKKSGRQLKLINLTPRVREIFTLTRLAEALEGHEEYLGLTPD